MFRAMARRRQAPVHSPPGPPPRQRRRWQVADRGDDKVVFVRVSPPSPSVAYLPQPAVPRAVREAVAELPLRRARAPVIPYPARAPRARFPLPRAEPPPMAARAPAESPPRAARAPRARAPRAARGAGAARGQAGVAEEVAVNGDEVVFVGLFTPKQSTGVSVHQC